MAQKSEMRVVVVDDSAETRDYLQKLLQFERNIEVVGTAANGRDAVNVAREVKPDLILMDINMPVMDGISAAEIIFREMPSVRVVMMSVQSEMAYLRRAMQVGAREFLIKPFTHDELVNILGEVSTLARRPDEVAAAPGLGMIARPGRRIKQATLVTVFSPRGGAGCSTVALNLAVALQGQRKANALLIDGSLRFGALDAMLNLQPKISIGDMIPAIDDMDLEFLHDATMPHTSGIRLLAAPRSPEMADLLTVKHLERIVGLARQSHDYVVADVGSSLDDRVLHFMDAADLVFVLLIPDIPAVKNVRAFLEVAESLDYGPEKVKLVLNRARPRGGIDAEAIQRHLKYPIVSSIPDSPGIAQMAINRGVPLILYERKVHKNMPVTRELLVLVEMVPEPGFAMVEAPSTGEPARAIEGTPSVEHAQEAERRSFFERLFGQR